MNSIFPSVSDGVFTPSLPKTLPATPPITGIEPIADRTKRLLDAVATCRALHAKQIAKYGVFPDSTELIAEDRRRDG